MKVNILMNVKSDRHIHAVASFHPLRGYTRKSKSYIQRHIPPYFNYFLKYKMGNIYATLLSYVSFRSKFIPFLISSDLCMGCFRGSLNFLYTHIWLLGSVEIFHISHINTLTYMVTTCTWINLDLNVFKIINQVLFCIFFKIKMEESWNRNMHLYIYMYNLQKTEKRVMYTKFRSFFLAVERKSDGPVNLDQEEVVAP